MILEIIEEVAATASKNKKLEILNYHKNNDVLKRVIRMAYDPFLNFWIKKIPAYSYAEGGIGTRRIHQALDQLETLASREVTGNAAIERLQHILECQDTDNAIIIERIIGKDLRAGFSAGTANKIWPGLVMEYPCMLCSPFEERLVEKITWPAILQLKMDGLRFNAIVKDGHVEYRTRNGKLMDLLGALDTAFITMADGASLVFDGELLVLDEDNKPLPRQTGNGILVKAQKGTLSLTEASYIAATLWDVIDAEAFTKGKWNEDYADRWLWLSAAVSKTKSAKIKLVESQTVETIEQCLEIVEGYIAQGLEGAILKDVNGTWEDKRVRHQIKFKGELDCDLVCIGWDVGTGKNSQRLGALVLQSADGKVRTSVGSGFSDADRDAIGRDVIGKIVTVKYNARITKKDSDTDSLFLPIYVCIRQDKDTADNSKNIK
jgi:hypothetical protein